MSNKNRDFSYSSKSEPHKLRTKQILEIHPEVRDLTGITSLSKIIV